MPFMQSRAVTPQADAATPTRSRALVSGVLTSPGQSLDAATRSRMEPLFGFDFSQVRVHADADAARSAASIGARAYAVGPHIVFGGGEHAPNSRAGATLMAHELAHVVQQRGRMSADLDSLEIGASRGSAESSAHLAAQQVIAGRAASGLASHTGAASIQRWAIDDMSMNVTPRNAKGDNEPKPGDREPVWCQFGGVDRGDECKPLQACRTTGKSTWDFVVIYRVDGAPPASPIPAAGRKGPIEVYADMTYEPASGGEQPVVKFDTTGAYSGQGKPVFVQRVSFSSDEDGLLDVTLMIRTDAGVKVNNGSVECVRINCN
jgi:hypothetical protein